MAFADDSSFIFVIDENNNPLYGYKVIETQREDIFFGKVEPLKKWIILSKSALYISKNGFLYPVKNSVIIDKSQGLVLFVVDLTNKKSMSFSLDMIKIDRNIKVLLENKRKLLSKLEILFPPVIQEKEPISIERKETDLLSMAMNYEKIGQIQKAITIYEEIMKSDRSSLEITSKIASLYYKTGNFIKAKEFLQKLPKNDENIKKLIGILIIEKKFDEALKILNDKTFQDKKYVYYLRGIIHYLIGNKNEAYNEVLELSKIDKELSESLRDLLR
ncbi:MAG: tetratricopeptide repeat protein [Proteobacteria bacterium]|nr:tetratricopeptide repeat protein [Pseudomonadota bacterium]